MAMKQQGRKVYRTANGKMVDMDLLRQRNELTPAVGNARVNARGDELGPGGKIIRKKEDIIKDYYNQSQLEVQDERAVLEQTAEVSTTTASLPRSKAQKKAEQVSTPTAAEAADWEEDIDGNFVKKGE
tara:strand:+ start:88 stop:471 length:384 start_codon:yes stop_codon:yes gene_type:complete